MKMLELIALLALVACMLFIPGAYSIEFSFSASDGSESVSLSSVYSLDDSVSLSEDASLNVGQVEISDSRSLSGTGGIEASQIYSGSCGYKGEAGFSTTGSGSLTGTATLTPNSLSASQDVSASGSSSNAVMSLTNEGTAGVNLQVDQGSMTSSQSLSTGSAHASSSSHIVGSFTSNTYSSGSSINRNNIPYVSESADLYQNAWAPGAPGAFDHATFNVNPQTKIQPSVDVARPFDSVSAGPGTFNENVVIWKSLTVDGAGAGSTIVDGGNKGSVFTVNSGVNAQISDMTIEGGTGTYDVFSRLLGGGVYNLGILILDGCTISGNTAFYGGGIGNAGTTTINSGSISDNIAYGEGGGIYNEDGTTTINGGSISCNTAGRGGGGIYNDLDSTTTINDGTISGNTAYMGGGIYNGLGGTATITDSTIGGNTASWDGGGFLNYGSIAITSSTISGNTAVTRGGGIFNGGATSVTGSTISGNTALLAGGGIENVGITAITDSTISGNSALWGGGIANSFRITTVTGGTITGNYADLGGGIYNWDILNLFQYLGQNIAIKRNSAGTDGGGIFNDGGTIIPDYSNCDFGTGEDANTPNNHN